MDQNGEEFFAVFLSSLTKFDRFPNFSLLAIFYMLLILFGMVMLAQLARLLQYYRACLADGSLRSR
jgi:hypothetical protein